MVIDNIKLIYYESCIDEETSNTSFIKLPGFRCEEIKELVSIDIKKYKIKKIPVNVFELANKLGIKLVKYSQLTEYEVNKLESLGISRNSDGFFALVNKNGMDIPFIYYNDRKNDERIRFTILHEIGHFVLGHLEQSDLAEAEANFFAKYLIAPPVLVNKINPTDYMDIANIFNVSKDCAWYAFDYYKKWLRHYIRIGSNYTDYEKTILTVCSLEMPEF